MSSNERRATASYCELLRATASSECSVSDSIRGNRLNTISFWNLFLHFFLKFSKFSLLFNLWLPFRSQFKAPLSPMMTVNDWCNERAFSMNLLDKYPTQNIHWVYSFNLAKKRAFFSWKCLFSADRYLSEIVLRSHRIHRSAREVSVRRQLRNKLSIIIDRL